MNELVRRNIQDIYKMAPTQEGMYFHYLLDKSSLAYLEQTTYRLHGDLDITRVKQSLEELFKRYDILRTVFNHEKADLPLQVVLKEREVDFFFQDLRHIPDEKERERYMNEYKEYDKNRKFDLNKDVMMRVAVFRIGEQDYVFIWTSHHILMDGWCVEILVSDFFDIYNRLLINRPCHLEPVKQYRTYIEWLEEQDPEKAKTFWKNYLYGFEEMTAVPKLKRGTSANLPYKKEEVKLDLSEQQTSALGSLAAKHQVTLSTVMKAAWSIVLAKYNQKREVVFGGVVSGRPGELDGVEQMVGLFINIIPVRVAVENDMKLSYLLQRVQTDMAESEPFHYFSLASIQAGSGLKQNLFDHIMVFENYPLAERLGQAAHPSEESEECEAHYVITDVQSFEQTNYDFNIIIAPGESMYVQFDFNGHVYDKTMVKMMAKHYEHVLNQLMKDDQKRVRDIELMEDQEKYDIFDIFNHTQAAYPANRTIHDIFEEQAAKTPEHTACVFGGTSLSYRQLNERANRLARSLREAEVRSDQLVGLMADRSLEMVIGVLAILKAGGAYVPISPDYPEERIRYMLEDSETNLLLVQHHLQGRVAFAGKMMNLNDPEIYGEDGSNLEPISGPKSLAYVIYTSGSTGKPKGVMVEHHSVVNRLWWMQENYPVYETDTILQKTTFTFDVSVWELFWWSIAGSKVCLLTAGGEKDPKHIVETIAEQGITTMHFVPAMLHAFLDYVEQLSNGERKEKLGTLRQVFASGEALPPQHVARFHRLITPVNQVKLINLYGPTEATVDVSYFDCQADREYDVIPIGKPISNIQIYMVGNESEQLQPVGVAGELCISGVGLARGYLNRPELTAEKFVDNPFVPGEKMYRTGDLARWLPDGNIEYLGRIDSQVKIRGFRIELEEIESALQGYDKLQKAAVSFREAGNEKKLVAYITVHEELSVSELRRFLSDILPEYMIPAEFVIVHDIPLNSSGKIDRKRLKDLEGKRLLTQSSYKEPASNTEKVVAEIWKEVLNMDNVGINDNFFDLNGTSLDVMKVASKLKKAFDREFEIVSMFTYPTIASFSKHVIEQDEYEGIDEHRAVLQAANTRMLNNLGRMKQQAGRN
ncbi:putative non-ribosomal peptide ligase domain protein [Paenibacillus larvae subsp. larvae DSM 25430]|uniref:Putative non-ribosomal peptide ligase domain protein n=2 Tax=Paenibacillus larvae TaxID=1464 RepID=V9W641_9BACL|nr:non-ribosomal peptide synthetase [Paenibacillus larvae]AHD05618.1 putative non-ribosomal peptide ligase domain protein [Paenibacillus larvae subsp. larvae DSM 25430]AVG12167.1 putative non-ribosomal peptide ligase domain protein [Paenibacillus larvae subsp. larvae DSM 25430]MDR5570059.1 non-ribosomal peptide synthetase [Paenibacillus larvae]MDR5595911.1 non-ribosomal peptide synthetase [Paenibacillus larvae]